MSAKERPCSYSRPPIPVTVGGPWKLLLYTNPLIWEGFINEGPRLIMHEGVHWLVYSGNSVNRPACPLRYATADSPEDGKDRGGWSPSSPPAFWGESQILVHGRGERI